MPPDPPTTLCMLYIRGLVLGLLIDVLQVTNARRPGNETSARTDNCVLRAPHQSSLYMYAPPPLLQSLDPPLYSYKTRKHGTFIYRPNADLRPALAQALWRLWSKNITKECSSETDTSKSDDPQQYLNVLDDLNTRACLHITSYLSKHKFVDLDIDKEIEGTDPKLWEAICLLSRSTAERRGIL